MIVAEHDLRDRSADIFHEIFGRHTPISTLLKHCTDATQDGVGIRAAQHVAAALESLRTLGHVADRDVRHFENATLFLNSSAVTQDTEGVFFECDEIEKTKR